MKTIRGKKALVTGASSGIGRAIAVALAREGADLILVGRNEARLEATANEARSNGVTATCFRCDLSQPAEITATVQSIVAASTIDILVNNAGVIYYGATDQMLHQEAGQILSTNLLAPIQLVHELLPTLLSRPEAHIVNVASIAGLITMRKGSAYQASKFGLVGFSSALRAEYVRYGLGVSVLCPGLVRTPMLDRLAVDPETQKRRTLLDWASSTPEHVAEVTIRAIRANKGLVVTAGPLRFVWWLTRLSPRLTGWIMQQGWRRWSPG